MEIRNNSVARFHDSKHTCALTTASAFMCACTCTRVPPPAAAHTQGRHAALLHSAGAACPSPQHLHINAAHCHTPLQCSLLNILGFVQTGLGVLCIPGAFSHLVFYWFHNYTFVCLVTGSRAGTNSVSPSPECHCPTVQQPPPAC